MKDLKGKVLKLGFKRGDYICFRYGHNDGLWTYMIYKDRPSNTCVGVYASCEVDGDDMLMRYSTDLTKYTLVGVDEVRLMDSREKILFDEALERVGKIWNPKKQRLEYKSWKPGEGEEFYIINFSPLSFEFDIDTRRYYHASKKSNMFIKTGNFYKESHEAAAIAEELNTNLIKSNFFDVLDDDEFDDDSDDE